MTLGKASALTAAFVAVFAAGVWSGPYMTRHWQPESSTAVSAPAPSTLHLRGDCRRDAEDRQPARRGAEGCHADAADGA